MTRTCTMMTRQTMALVSREGRRALPKAALVVALSLVATEALAQEVEAEAWSDARPLPALRLGATGSLGAIAPPNGPDVPMPAGPIGLYGAGFGLDLRLGMQLTEWFALDLQLFAETLLLAGDARAGALVEFAPAPPFAFALGGGVGSMYLANLFVGSPSADFAAGVVRLEGRVRQELTGDDVPDIVFGAEAQVGSVFDGSLPDGTLLVGGRAFGGMLLH